MLLNQPSNLAEISSQNLILNHFIEYNIYSQNICLYRVFPPRFIHSRDYNLEETCVICRNYN